MLVSPPHLPRSWINPWISSLNCSCWFILLGRDKEGLEVIFQGNVFDQIKLVMEKGDVARFRIYEVCLAY